MTEIATGAESATAYIDYLVARYGSIVHFPNFISQEE
jgi:hypothetical protein